MPEPTRLTPFGGSCCQPSHTPPACGEHDWHPTASAIPACCPLVLPLTPLTPPFWLPGWGCRSAPPGRSTPAGLSLCPLPVIPSPISLADPAWLGAEHATSVVHPQKIVRASYPPKTRGFLRTRSSATVFSRHHRKTRRKRAVKPPWFDPLPALGGPETSHRQHAAVTLASFLALAAVPCAPRPAPWPPANFIAAGQKRPIQPLIRHRPPLGARAEAGGIGEACWIGFRPSAWPGTGKPAISTLSLQPCNGIRVMAPGATHHHGSDPETGHSPCAPILAVEAL